MHESYHIVELSLLFPRALHTAVARYDLILHPDAATCCRQFVIKAGRWGTYDKISESSFPWLKIPCRPFHSSYLLNCSSLSLFAKRGRKATHIFLQKTNQSSACPRVAEEKLFQLIHFLPTSSWCWCFLHPCKMHSSGLFQKSLSFISVSSSCIPPTLALYMRTQTTLLAWKEN